MARRTRPVPPNRPPGRPIPDRPLEPPGELPTVAVRRRGTTRSSTGRWSSARPGRSGRWTATSSGSSTATACRSGSGSGTAGRRSRCGCSRPASAPRASTSGASGSTRAVALRREALGLDATTNAYRRRPRRGGRPLGPDRRPLRRRALGRGVQPGDVPADRADPGNPRPRRRARSTSASTSTSGSRWPKTSRADRSPAPSSRRG